MGEATGFLRWTRETPTRRPVPVPAKIRPAGRKRNLRALGRTAPPIVLDSSAAASARATRRQLSSIVTSIGVPSWVFSRYLASQICREIGDRYGEALALNNGGLVYGEVGRFEDAITGYRQALEIFRELGDLYREGDVLTNLGVVHRALGRAEEAQHCWERALVGFEDAHDPDAVHNADRVGALLRQLDQGT